MEAVIQQASIIPAKLASGRSCCKPGSKLVLRTNCSHWLVSPPLPICPFNHSHGGTHSPKHIQGIKHPTKEELQLSSHLPLPSLLPLKGHFITCSCGHSATTCCAQRQMRPAHLICIKPVSWLHISRYIPNSSTNNQIFSSLQLLSRSCEIRYLSFTSGFLWFSIS